MKEHALQYNNSKISVTVSCEVSFSNDKAQTVQNLMYNTGKHYTILLMGELTLDKKGGPFNILEHNCDKVSVTKFDVKWYINVFRLGRAQLK